MSGKSTGGTYRGVIHGDAFDELATLDEDSAHAAVVDYPWPFMEDAGGTGYFGNEGTSNREFEAFPTEPLDRFADVLSELARVLVDGGWIFAFGDDRIVDDVRHIVEAESSIERRPTLCWDRRTIGTGVYFRARHLPIVAATVGETDRKVRDRPTVLEATRQDGFLREHDYPTGKPPELYRQLLAPPVLRDGERLLEPFCGGSPGAAVAAERGLDYWGADVEKEAVDRAESFFQQRRLGQAKLTDGGDKYSTETSQEGDS